MTYESIFLSIDSSQIVLVTGEEDNVYVPGYPSGGGRPDAGAAPGPWDGMNESGALVRGQELRFETPEIPAGSYKFEMTGTGDADMYVRIGTAPTTQLWDCRPYKAGSNETCLVSLNSPAPIHVLLRGFAAESSFNLNGAKQ